MTSTTPAEVREAVERVIVPVVEGQLRSFAHAHPSIVDAVDWRHSHPTKLDAFVASAAKRITRSLLCEETLARLRSATAGEQEGGKSAMPFDAMNPETSRVCTGSGDSYSDPDILAELARLTCAVETKDEALKPFAAVWDEKTRPYSEPPITPDVRDEDHAWGLNRRDLFWGDFRRARTALNPSKEA